jgi:hypothetical protein
MYDCPAENTEFEGGPCGHKSEDGGPGLQWRYRVIELAVRGWSVRMQLDLDFLG